jgi:hypothetical protein
LSMSEQGKLCVEVRREQSREENGGEWSMGE